MPGRGGTPPQGPGIPTGPVIPAVKPNEPDAKKPVSPTAGTDMVQRRITQWADGMHLSIKGIAERPDTTTGDVEYVVKDVFTTRAGSWDDTGERYSAPQWAKDAYLAGAFQKAYEP